MSPNPFIKLIFNQKGSRSCSLFSFRFRKTAYFAWTNFSFSQITHENLKALCLAIIRKDIKEKIR